jgi:5-methylcytosine-specific restriction enzyme A
VAKKRCLAELRHGCRTLVPADGPAYCDEHARTKRKTYDAARGTSAQRGYDAAWRRSAAAFLRANPMCVGCGGKATHADHRQPRRQLVAAGVADPDAWSQLQPLCASCHSRKTAAEDGGFGNPRASL